MEMFHGDDDLKLFDGDLMKMCNGNFQTLFERNIFYGVVQLRLSMEVGWTHVRRW